MSSSELSSPLSSPRSSDQEDPFVQPKKDVGITRFFPKAKKKAAPAPKPVPRSPSPPKREPSPPHEYVLADNPDIAFVVAFASRFHTVLPKSVPSFGPQDLERSTAEAAPGELVETLLCALLSLLLNRKKPVERAHYHRALDEALTLNRWQWPGAWEQKSPLNGGKTFASMLPAERLNVIKHIIFWALSSSEAVQGLIKESYKQVRREDDINQPLSVQPWGQDGYKRRYWLIEGRDDTEFRVYRESNVRADHVTWWSVAGNVDELKALAAGLSGEGTQAARRLSEKIALSFGRLEASLEKRKKREYRVARKAQFERRDPGISLYEGRTRGKKLKYTYSSDEEGGTGVTGTRRSSRPSGHSSKDASVEPVVTASGRQVKPRAGGIYGESMLSGQARKNGSPATGVPNGTEPDEDEQEISSGRPARSRRAQAPTKWSKGGRHIAGYNEVDEMDDEEDAASSATEDYGGDGDGDDDDDDQYDTAADDDDDDESDEDEISDDNWESDEAEDLPRKRKSKVIRLRLRGQASNGPPTSAPAPAPAPAIIKTEAEVELKHPDPHSIVNGTTELPSLAADDAKVSVHTTNGVE